MIDHRGNVLIECDDKVRSLLVNLHRGIMPDVDALSADEKKELLRVLDVETMQEMVHKHPDREATRNRVRAILGAS